MNSVDEFERYVGPRIRSMGESGRARYLAEVLERTQRTRQRPAWASLGRWLPAPLADVRIAVPARAGVYVLLLLALLLALAIALFSAGSPRRLPAPFGPAANGLMAFDGGGIVYLADADGSDPRPLTDASVISEVPVWSPDGTKLAYLQSSGSYDAPRDGRLVIHDIERGATVQIKTPTGISIAADFTWSQDSTLVAMSGKDANDRESIYLADPSAQELRRLDVGDMAATCPAWGPGGRLAFEGRQDGKPALWVIRSDGSAARRLTTEPLSTVCGLQWSPDGSRILYHAGTAAEPFPTHLFVIGADGSDRRQVTFGESGEGDGTWSPDGQRVAFVRGYRGVGTTDPGAEIVVVNADGKNERILTAGPLGWYDPVWSPDGKKILGFEKISATGCESTASGCQYRPIVLDVAGGKAGTLPVLPSRTDAPAELRSVAASSWQRLAES